MVATHEAPLNILTETVMRSSGFDDDLALLLLVGEFFWNEEMF